ncbi:uncharacterized protein LOC141680330 [Apium graveolens]|uniref:uncharacterized protein LOC141680330 n=1 Tax=Apium graveolens TaxID=4045 RepID=UPI003D7BAB1F
MHKPESSGRMLKWTVELSQFEVDYKPRTAIKGQVLADFIIEFPPHQEVEQGTLIVMPSAEEVGLESENSAPWWSLFVDGASYGDGAGAGIELISPETHKIRRATHLAFHATNNDAEYEALINGLKLALEMKVGNLNVFSDSMIVVYQINGGYQTKGSRTELYLKCAQRIIARFNEVMLELIPRGQNEGADELAKLGSHREATLLGVVPLDIQRQPSVPEHEVGSIGSELGPTWMIPILTYIKEGSLLDEKNEARRIKYKVARYVIYDRVLYRRGFSVSLLKCIDGDECKYILRKVHGAFVTITRGSSLAHKIPRQGYYWPTLKKDVFEFSRACDKCQRYANYYNSLVPPLTSLMSPWPFAICQLEHLLLEGLFLPLPLIRDQVMGLLLVP